MGGKKKVLICKLSYYHSVIGLLDFHNVDLWTLFQLILTTHLFVLWSFVTLV